MYTDFTDTNHTNLKISDLNDIQFSWIKNSLVYKNLDVSEDIFLRELKLPICSINHLNIHDHLEVYDKWCVLEFPVFFYGFFLSMYSKKDFFDIIINSNIHDISKDEITFNLISDGNNNLKSLYDFFIVDKRIYMDFIYPSYIVFNASSKIHVSDTINGPDISEDKIIFKGQFNKLVKDNQDCDLNNNSNIKKNLDFEYDFSVEGNNMFLILTPLFDLNNLNLTFTNTFKEDLLNVFVNGISDSPRKGVIENNRIKVQINYSRFFYEEDEIGTCDNCLSLSIFFYENI